MDIYDQQTLSTQLDHLRQWPDEIISQTKSRMWFDVYYDQVIRVSLNTPTAEADLARLLELIQLLGECQRNQYVLYIGSYLLRLQSNHLNYFEVFEALLNAGIHISQPEFLVYTLLAREELSKLRLLRTYIDFTSYQGLFSVCLYYGRLKSLNYLLDELQLVPKAESLLMGELQPRLIYYEAPSSPREARQIVGSHYQIQGTLRRFLEVCPVFVDAKHLHIWIQRVRSVTYGWEDLQFEEVYQVLQPHISLIPLTEDFGEFNLMIFGYTWSDREELINRYLNLETQLERLQMEFERLQELYQKFLDGY